MPIRYEPKGSARTAERKQEPEDEADEKASDAMEVDGTDDEDEFEAAPIVDVDFKDYRDVFWLSKADYNADPKSLLER